MTHPAASFAPYACPDGNQHRRLLPEAPCPLRTSFARDRDRISRSYAFRRLKGTTQVFPSAWHPTFRTRLTHSMEVAQTARILARNLRLNEDLTEALALAHDLGHPPFGHCGEDALAACTAPWFSFNHNDQTFRWLTLLEQSYGEHPGLNLTWDTLEGIVKHNGPLSAAKLAALPTIAAYSMDLKTSSYGSLEAQIASLADDITYVNHDVEDAVESGCLPLDKVLELPFYAQLYEGLSLTQQRQPHRRIVFELVRGGLATMVTDVLDTTSALLHKVGPTSVQDVRDHTAPLALFSDAMQNTVISIKSFLMTHVYLNPMVCIPRDKGATQLTALFHHCMEHPQSIPDRWRPNANADDAIRARAVTDYIASRSEYDIEPLLKKWRLAA